jgi:uncharacterized protein with HEPN domain
MSPRDHASLLDILGAADHIAIIVDETQTLESFVDDWKAQDILARELEIIGEAVKRISMAFREQHPEIPWRGYAGIRDVLAHRYDDIDLMAVWTAAIKEVPEIARQISALLPPGTSE